MLTKKKIYSFLSLVSLVVMIGFLASCRASGGVSIGDRTDPRQGRQEITKICLLMTPSVNPVV
jgi:hypothetical protein